MSGRAHQRPGKAASTELHSPKHYNATPRSLHDSIIDVCAEVGIGPLPELPIIGHVRCPGIDKPPTNRACWINIKRECAHIVDHASGYTTTVFEGAAPNPAERVKIRRKQAEANQMLRSKQEAAILDAQRVWQVAQPCVASEYTERKRIKTYGCRWHVSQHCLLVPLRNIDGETQSLQRIYDSGDKRYWPGAPTKGLFFLIGEIKDHSSVLICEGFATGATLHKHTSKTVICAMTAGNLLTVSEAVKHRYPDAEITICGDDDRQTDGNPGLTKAIEAADAIGAKFAMPELCACCTCTDWNDQQNCPRGANG